MFINLLEKYDGISTAFSLPITLLTKGIYQEHWKEYVNDSSRNLLKRERSVIERVQGDMKMNHSLTKARYIGLQKMRLQSLFAAMAHNLKTMVTLLTGARLKPV